MYPTIPGMQYCQPWTIMVGLSVPMAAVACLLFRVFCRDRCGKDEPRLVCALQHAPPCFVYAAVFQPAVLDLTRGTTAGEILLYQVVERQRT